MLPDFPEVKSRARREFVRAVHRHIPQHAPILQGIRHFRIHEGRSSRLTRQDLSEDNMQFEATQAMIEMEREQMRRITVAELLEHVSKTAEQFAEAQSRLLFARVSQAVDEVGNVVSASELGNKEAFLEMQRRMEVDFDPDTLEPRNQVIVLHPSQVQSFMEQVAEWDKDPAFVEEMARIRERQIEAWRARENRRKLVD